MKPKPSAKEPKYRPVLTASQILHMLTLAKSEVPLSDESFSVIATLAPFQAKIENNGIVPAYIPAAVAPELDLYQSLSETALEAYGSKEEYWNACYTKYCLSPTSCSLAEIQGATEHKYLAGLMTDEEVKLFEAITEN